MRIIIIGIIYLHHHDLLHHRLSHPNHVNYSKQQVARFKLDDVHNHLFDVRAFIVGSQPKQGVA